MNCMFVIYNKVTSRSLIMNFFYCYYIYFFVFLVAAFSFLFFSFLSASYYLFKRCNYIITISIVIWLKLQVLLRNQVGKNSKFFIMILLLIIPFLLIFLLLEFLNKNSLRSYEVSWPFVSLNFFICLPDLREHHLELTHYLDII